MDAAKFMSSGPAVLTASWLTAINQLLINAQPLIFGAVAVRIGLGNAELGQLAAVIIATSTIGAISGPLWVRRVDWRWFCGFALVAASAAFAAGSQIDTLTAAALVFGSVSFFLGLLAPPSYGCLGDAKDSGRAFAVAVVFQSSLAAVTTLGLSMIVIPAYSSPGAFLVLAVIVAAGLPFVGFLPAAGAKRDAPAPPIEGAPLLSAAAIPAYAMLVAKALFIGGVLGYWIFIERVGAERGISGQLIGLTISLCAVASAISAGIAGYLAGRMSSLAVAYAGTFIILLAFGLLTIAGFAAFVVSNLCFAFGWGLAQSAYWAVLRNADATNRLFVAGPAASGVGGVAAGLAAGPVIAIGGLTAVTIASGVYLILAAVIAYGVASRRPARIDEAVPPREESPVGAV